MQGENNMARAVSVVSKKEAIERGERLKACIAYLGMSRKEFCQRVGYSYNHIGYLCSGKRPLTEETARALSEGINRSSDKKIDYRYLLGETKYINSSEEFISVWEKSEEQTQYAQLGLLMLLYSAGIRCTAYQEVKKDTGDLGDQLRDSDGKPCKCFELNIHEFKENELPDLWSIDTNVFRYMFTNEDGDTMLIHPEDLDFFLCELRAFASIQIKLLHEKNEQSGYRDQYYLSKL